MITRCPSSVIHLSLTFHIFSKNVLYQVCVFRANQKNKRAATASDWLRHFRLLLDLKPLSGIQRNLTVSKISPSSTKFVFFRPIGKTRWLSRPLIGWDICNFYSNSGTAERNSSKLDRKQDLNVLYQVCVFGPIGKPRWPPRPLIGWDIFLWNCWTEFYETWQEVGS